MNRFKWCLLDEFLKPYIYRKEVSSEELESWHGNKQKYVEEDEKIVICVLPIDEAVEAFEDSKSLAALYLNGRYKVEWLLG
ncbi:MAG: hypothetical protein HQL32_09170 [Planctomycetes bacterium]|nr:hypothetical protein [Planctomycetota bacterium]